MSEEKRIVKSYEEEMQSLNDDLVKMGSLTESQLSDTIQAIVKIDKEAAENIVKNDAQINELRAKIDDQISTVLVKRAPMAIDLRKSKDKAIEVWRNDEQVDDLTHIAMNEVANFLGKNKKNLELATHLLFVTKNIERAGDHVTNIAESLYYLIEGEYLEGARPKGKEFVKDK